MDDTYGINGKNRKLLYSLNSSGKNSFSVREASEILELPPDKTRLILSYFERRGWLARVKRGLYVSVPLGTANPHEYREAPWLVAGRVFSPCYIGGWSAAEYWELTEQIFNSVYVVTSRPFRSRITNVQGTDFVLKFRKKIILDHTKGVWIGNEKVFVSGPAQTVVDILDDPAAGAGIRHSADIVEAYFRSDAVNEDELLARIGEYGNRTIYKRLGFILESLGLSSAGFVEICRKNISRGYSVLDPTIKIKGTYSRRWNLRVNAGIK
jgi:predicted transcriptional regulator of viral defense system